MRKILVVLGLVGIAGTAWGYPGEGILYGKSVIRPYWSLDATYDSNAYMDEDDVRDDVSYGTRLGVEFDRQTELTALKGDAWYLRTEYDKASDRDHSDYGEGLSLSVIVFNAARLTLHQEYSKSSEDEDFFTDFLGDITHFGGNLAFQHQWGERTEVSYGYRGVAGTYNDDDIYDWDSQGLTFGLGYELTEASQLYFSGVASIVNSDGHAEKANSYKAHVGVRTTVTDKTSGLVGVGWQYMEDDPPISIPSVESAIRWQATEKLAYGFNLSARILPAIQYEETFNIIWTGKFSAQWLINEEWAATATAAYQNNRYHGEAPVWDETIDGKTEDIIQAGFLLNYRAPLQFLNAFGGVNYQEKASSIDQHEYNRYHIKVGVKLQY